MLCRFVFLLWAICQLSPSGFCGADEPILFPRGVIETGEGSNSISVADFNNDGFDDLATANYFESTTILFGVGGGEFSDPLVLSTARSNNVVSRDFNGDGNVDLLSVEFQQNRIVVFLGDGTGRFGESVTPIDLYNTRYADVIVSDFNKDQILDIALTNFDRVDVLFGNGDGSFAFNDSYPASFPSSNLVAADIDGDLTLDLIVSPGDSPHQLAVLIGAGEGTFEPAQFHDALFYSLDLAVADFNSDGILDIAAPPTMYMGLGNGQLSSPQLLPVGLPRVCQSLDFDGDGISDLLVGGFASQFEVLTGNGDGTFDSLQNLGLDDVSDLQFADLDQDGDRDIVVTNFESDSITIFDRLADGSFEGLTAVPVNDSPGTIASDDLDGDGDTDIVVGGALSGSVSVLLGCGDGSFVFSDKYSVDADSAASLALVDLNGDGNKDVVTASQSSPNVSVLIGSSEGIFEPVQTFPTSAGLNAVAAGDFNGDGSNDVVAAQGGTLIFLPGNGDGTLGESSQISIGAGFIFEIRVEDMNDDGIADVVIANSQNSAAPDDMRTMISNGDGTFQKPVVSPPLGFRPISFELADFDGDSHLDLFVVGTSVPSAPTTVIMLGSGGGVFQSPIVIEEDQEANGSVVGDFDLDGVLDVASVDDREGVVSVQLGNGDGTFHERKLFRVGTCPRDLTVGDFDHDGYPDLVACNRRSVDLTVLINQIPTTVFLGDINRDCNVNLLDVAPFVSLLSSGDFQAEADINGDLQVDLLDVAPFIALINGE